MAKSPDTMNPSRRKCAMETCDRLVGEKGARGLCPPHYKQHKAAKFPDGLAHLKPILIRSLPGQRPKCAVINCEKLSRERGLCVFHRQREKSGIGFAQPKRTANGAAVRFVAEIAKAPWQEACIVWPYARMQSGYAFCGGKPASREVCIAAHGPPPFNGAEAAHSCGRGHEGCVNPHHLRWATHSENMLDRREHGTNYCGARHHGTKLDDETVRRVFADDRPENVIASEAGCTVSYVRQIKAGTARSLVTGAKSHVKPRLRLPDEVKQAICSDPRSSRKIAATFGVNRTTILNLKRANG